MARMKMVWRKCWSCDHVNPGVHMIRNRRAFRCEACGEVNDYVDSQYSVKTVFYIKPNYWTTFEKERVVYWTDISERDFDSFAVAWSDWRWGE